MYYQVYFDHDAWSGFVVANPFIVTLICAIVLAVVPLARTLRAPFVLSLSSRYCNLLPSFLFVCMFNVWDSGLR